jgi:Ca-activated chloride channel homolog
MTTLTLKADRLLTSDRGRDTHFVLLELRAPSLERRRERAGLNLSLVLDRSGSMGGASKFPLAQKAVESAVARLDDRDRVSLVVYDDQIDVLMASAHATPAVREDVRKALGAVTPRGTTALFDGYLHGAQQVAAHVEAHSLGKVLLLTDGLANVGLQDSAEIARHVSELRARGVHTSTFGVGADFNQLLLEAMADAGGGSFYFVENGRQIEDLLTSEVGEALETVARDVRVTVKHPPDVQVRLLDAFPAERASEATAVCLGALTSEQVVELLFEIEVPARPSGSVTRLDVAVEDAEHALKSPSGVVEFRHAPDAEVEAEPVDSHVVSRAARRIRLEASERIYAMNYEGRRGEVRGAASKALEYLKRIAKGHPDVEAQVTELEGDVAQAESALSAMDLKKAYFAQSRMRRGRDLSGKARKGSEE